MQTAASARLISSPEKARPVYYSTVPIPGAEELADGDLNLQLKLCSCLSWPLREAKNYV